MQRIKTFLVVCISMLTNGLLAQMPQFVHVDKIIPDHIELKKIPVKQSGFNTASDAGSIPQSIQLLAIPPEKEALPPLRFSGGSEYVSHLGFFCQKELQVQKVTRLPVFFRLGSLDYVNRLEGK